MKRGFITALLLFLSGIAYAGGEPVVSKEIRIVTGDWQPYISKKYADGGQLARIISSIFAEQGITAKFTYLPWKEGYDAVMRGDFDAIVPTHCGEDRAKKALCSDHIFAEEIVLYYKNRLFDWNEVSDLSGLRVGVTNGQYYGPEFSRLVRDGHIRTTDMSLGKTSVMALQYGKIDVYPQYRSIGDAAIRENLPKAIHSRVKTHSKPLHVAKMHLLMSKENPKAKHFMNVFNKGLSDSEQIRALAQMTGRTTKSTFMVLNSHFINPLVF